MPTSVHVSTRAVLLLLVGCQLVGVSEQPSTFLKQRRNDFFPLKRVTIMPNPPSRVYARQLLSLGYGYPLWTPEPSNQFLRYRRDGLRIGDVGVVDPEDGSFDVFFNICLHREHPFHRVNGVPDNFICIDLDELDIAVYPHAENPSSVISTSSVTTLRTAEPSAGEG